MSDEHATSTPTIDPTDEAAAPPVAPVVASAHAHEVDTHSVEHAEPHEQGGTASVAVAEESTTHHRDEPATHEPTHVAPTDALVPVPEPISEDLVPVHDHAATTATTAPEPETQPAPESVADPLTTDEPTPPKPAKKARATKSKTAPPAAAVAPAADPIVATVPEPADTGAGEPAPSESATPSESANPSESIAPSGPPAEPVVENKKRWYAIKVQSGREDSIKAAILRKVRIEGLEEFFGRIEIPFEEVSEKKSVKVKDKKTGETSYQEKKVTRKRKKFQGYLFAELEFNDRILYLFRETSGVGDFLNLRQKKDQAPVPEPMPDHEVQSMLTGVAVRDPSKKGKIKLDFEKGDKVRVREGSFANHEGEVKAIIEAKDPNEAPKVMVVLTFWGRPLEVELESSQVEKV